MRLHSHAVMSSFPSPALSLLPVDDLQATLNTSQLKLKRLTNQEAEKVDK